MTKEEACAFLNIQDETDYEEIYENKLFEHKQFFTSRAILPSVWFKRIEKLIVEKEAFDCLLNKDLGQVENPQMQDQSQFQTIREVVEWFHKVRNQLRVEIFSTQTYSQLMAKVNQLLRVHEFYAIHWNTVDLINDEVKLSAEPDDMTLISWIKSAEKSEITQFNELEKNQNAPQELRIEQKRLTLLYQN